ncbi:MAG: hypothetical protein ACK5P7_08400 [Bdellovibrio sp.]|jgi:predicted ribosome quality control (RQC) complex YloA/Tae2 family protein
MKSLNSNELVSFCEWMRSRLVNAQLQDLWTDGEIVIFQFYSWREIYLGVRLHPSAPLMWIQEQKPRVKKAAKPVTLFLNSHARNLVLRDIHLLLDQGRVLEFVFAGGEGRECVAQFDLIPKNPNLTVRASGKSISWNKPAVLPPPQLPEFEVIEKDWAAWSFEVAQYHGVLPSPQKAPAPDSFSTKVLLEPPKVLAPKAAAQKKTEKDLQKKKKAILAMRENLGRHEADQYRALGDALKSSEVVPEDLLRLYDQKKSRFDNMAAAYQKAKDVERKRNGTMSRIEVLEKEVQKLQAQLEAGRFDQLVAPRSRAGQMMKKAHAAGRRLQLEGGLEAALGKSGADNLAILRQARGWDLWVHLKDEPGAHAVLFRNRDQNVPRETLQAVAEWVWKESKGKKMSLSGGQKYDVIVVECRFVKPIKGDKLGRVTYHYPQVHTFTSQGS